MSFVHATDALAFCAGLSDQSVDLLLTDPPYYGIIRDSWDNQWPSVDAFVDWLARIFEAARPKLKPTGSLVFFSGIGRHRQHPLFRLIERLEETYVYRNWITWGKRRAYGKKRDYLFTREEIVWLTCSDEFTFNVPYLEEKRTCPSMNPEYPAKSEYKRVTNVWTDITELFRPRRYCQKPEPLMARLIQTHSNPGDMVLDPFCGYGTTGIVALKLGRRFRGCEAIEADAVSANARCEEAAS